MVSDLDLGYRPSGIAVGMLQSSRVEIALLAAEQPAINFYSIALDGTITRTGSSQTSSTYRSITAADLDGNGASEYICIASSGNSLSILRRNQTGTLEESIIPIAESADRCVAADLNRDKRHDVLLFGKSAAGVTTFFGQPNGSLKKGPVLFADISVSDIVPTDLNGDGITDILALNWLSNQLVVFYGIGSMVYSEQIAVQLPAEPEHLTITPVSRQREFRVAITIPEANQVHVYSGNSIGDYRLMSTLSTDGKPSGVQFARVNADDYPDLVTSTGRGLVVWVGASHTWFAQPAVFGGARSITGWIVADVDRDNRNDCVMIDRNTQRLICLSNAENATPREPAVYAAGASSTGLVMADFNGDGKLDVGVVNSMSSTFSVLLNTGMGRLSGQISFPLPDNPTFAHRVSSPMQSEHTIIASHSKDDKVTVMALPSDMRQTRTFSVPTGGSPFVVSAKQEGGMLQFFVRHRSARDGTYLLSLFEQINPRQFVERSLRPALPTKIIALSVDDGAAPGTFELLYATNDKSTKRTTVWFGESEAGLEFKSTKPLFSYPDSTASTQYLLGGYMDGDRVKDVVISLGPPRKELGIWYGSTPSDTTGTIEWIRNIQPSGDDAIILKDVDGDGTMDVTLLDTGRRSVLTIFGKEPQDKKHPVTVAPAMGVHSIRVALLQEGAGNDLVLSNPDRGTLSVISNAFDR